MIKKILILLLLISNFTFVFALADEESKAKDILYLSIDDVSALALYNNLDIQIAKFDAYAKRTALMDSESIFDTMLSANVSYTDNQLKQSSVLAGSKSITSEYSLGISKKLPTGTTIGIEASNERSWSNSAYAAMNPAHDASIGLTLKQSLGKNFFGFIDRANIKITKLEIKASDCASLEKIESYLASAQEAYWNLVLRKEQLRIKKEMLKKADELFSIYKNKFSIGLVEDPEILAVETLVLKRECGLLAAYDLLNLAKDDLLLKINAADETFQMLIELQDELSFLPEKKDFFQTLKVAIENRRDYEEAKFKLEAKKINLEMKKNNLWPEIDLDASFERNGLDSNFITASKMITEEDNPKFSIGLSFQFPLENREARAAMSRAEIERAKQIVMLKKIEKKILSSIHEKVKKINLSIGQVLTNKRIVQLQNSKLRAENLRFSFGRSDSDTLIRYQEDLLISKLALAQSIFDYKHALIDLELASNTLLDKYWKDQL